MGTILAIHALFGERILPLLVIIAAIAFTVTWRPNTPPNRWLRLFPVLVDIQVTMGLIYWAYLIAIGGAAGAATYLSLPFLLHPILGLLSAGIAHMAVKPVGPLKQLGRWGALVTLAVLLVSIVGGIVAARSV